MSESNDNFSCPICGTALRKFIRVRGNEYVVVCSQTETCRTIEGKGENFSAALKDIQHRALGKQKALL